MTVTIDTTDRHSVECRIEGRANTGPVLLVVPAMGVRASFYLPLAQALASLGTTVMCADLRGNGGHSVRRRDGHDWGYEEMIGADLYAQVSWLRDAFPGRPVLLLGHSLGGQLGCLYAARHPGQLDGLILTGSGMVDWRGWGRARFKRWLQYVLIGALTRALGYFPGERMGFAGNEPPGQMRDWVHSALTGRYRPTGASIDYEAALQAVRLPLLAITFHSDDYAPKGAAQRLLAKMPAADIEHLDLADHQVGLHPAGHFRWAREPDRVLPYYRQWLQRHFPGDGKLPRS